MPNVLSILSQGILAPGAAGGTQHDLTIEDPDLDEEA